jgi:predicted acetyltransferase
VSHAEANVEIVSADRDARDCLAALFQLYAYDFSDILSLDVADTGRFAVPPLDAYWTDPRCHAFLVRVDSKLAGFALVQERSRLTGDLGVCDMAEFFVMRRFRRRGVGEHVAAWLFDRFRGPWEVRQKARNVAGTAFWRHAIGAYTAGRFEEVAMDDARWHGPVQHFDSRDSAERERGYNLSLSRASKPSP